jgi:hypothetical protein
LQEFITPAKSGRTSRTLINAESSLIELGIIKRQLAYTEVEEINCKVSMSEVERLHYRTEELVKQELKMGLRQQQVTPSCVTVRRMHVTTTVPAETARGS